VECLRKNGHARVQLSVDTDHAHALRGPASSAQHAAVPLGWIVLRSGDARIATFPTRLRGLDAPAVFATMTRERVGER
jgi:enediyne polyketide synthase